MVLEVKYGFIYCYGMRQLNMGIENCRVKLLITSLSILTWYETVIYEFNYCSNIRNYMWVWNTFADTNKHSSLLAEVTTFVIYQKVLCGQKPK